LLGIASVEIALMGSQRGATHAVLPVAAPNAEANAEASRGPVGHPNETAGGVCLRLLRRAFIR